MQRLARTLGPRVPEPAKRLLRRALGRHWFRLFPDWHRRVVGGKWEEIGELQKRFLVEQGLRPDHRLLDLGCGSLRAGIPLVRYQDPGRYHGLDASAELLSAARYELARHGLEGKGARLHCDAGFDVQAFGEEFDYVLAHSLFTHLPINSILVCLLSVEKVLRRPGGRFYATFFENARGTKRLEVLSHPRDDGPPIRTQVDADRYHYGLDLFEWLCEGTGLSVEYVGEWGSPRSQRMLLFTPATG